MDSLCNLKFGHISHLAENIRSLAPSGYSGRFQLRFASSLTEKKMQASEALHHGPEPEKSRFFAISAQIEKA